MRIDKIDVVAGFQLDQSAPLKLGASLASIAEANKVAVTPLVVPSAAPAFIPRFMLGLQQAVLQAAFDRVQLTITPPDHIRESAEEVFAFVRNEVSRNLLPLVDQSWMQNSWAGVVVGVSFPIKDATALGAASRVASAITNLPWTDDLQSFQLQIGRRIDDFFHTFTISGYELRSANIELEAGQAIELDVSKIDSVLDEAGVRIALDINTKANPNKLSGTEAIEAVLVQVNNALENVRRDLNLEEVIS